MELKFKGLKMVNCDFLGEIPEENLYNALKEHYTHENDTVVVIHGCDLKKFDLDVKENNTNEKDFIIINFTHRYIIVVEAKYSLDKGDSIEKSLEQLKDAKERFESWFQTEMDKFWKFIPIIYCEETTTEKICESCKNHVIKGVYHYLTNIFIMPPCDKTNCERM